MLRNLDIPTATTLGRIEPHRLDALIIEDLRRYPRSKIGDINDRIGSEIPRHRLKRAVVALISQKQVAFEGDRKARVYWRTG